MTSGGYSSDGFGESGEVGEVTAVVGAVEFESDKFAQGGETALQFPADLAAFAEEENLHRGFFLFFDRSGAVLLDDPVAVAAAQDVLDPGLVIEIPLHGLPDAGLEGLGRFPAEFAFELTGVDGVASVVAGAVGDVGDRLLYGWPWGRGRSSSRSAQTVCTISRLGFSFQPPTL